MKKNKFLSTVVIISTLITTSFAQTINIDKRYSIFENNSEQIGFHPVLNENGDLLLFTSENHTGLSLYKFSDRSVERISDQPGAGYEAIFNDTSTKIFHRNMVIKSHLRYNGIESYDINTKQKIEILEPQRNLKQSKTFNNGLLVLSENNLLKATIGKDEEKIDTYIWTDNLKMNLYHKGKRIIMNPVKDATAYIWVSLSPDGKKILFHAVSKGTYICDLQGKLIADLGYLNAPKWYNNDFVIGMQDEDDGHIVKASRVIIKSLDGKIEKQLSENNQIAMYPTAAINANKIAYSTYEGEIYIVELSVK